MAYGSAVEKFGGSMMAGVQVSGSAPFLLLNLLV